MDIMRLSIEDFTRFQTEIIRQSGNCRTPLYARDKCYPRYTEDECQKCAKEWKEQADDDS